MKKFNKIISMLLAAFMIIGSISALFTVNVFAEDTTETGTETGTETSTDVETGSGSETGAESGSETEAPKKEVVDHINRYFATPDEKIATMELAYQDGSIKLYVDSTSGEVAYVNEKTGEKLFTNPYDVATSTGNEATKYEILSQIIVTFTDATGQERIFTSYQEAAERGQITIENIKNGIRVEYAIGREQSKILVPRLISMERFEEMILKPLLEVFGDELYNPRSENTDVFDVQKVLSYFMIYSVDKLDYTKAERANIENTFGGLYDDLRNSDAQYARALKKFPIIETMPVYVFDPDASEKELTRAEEIIQKYCPEYTYEELEYDHILTEYKSDDANPPVFRMAIEYKIESDGLSVRLPANGIRFNESLYTLEHIQILPYMGAGNSAYKGYNFFPDGSGTLFDFQNLNTNQTRAVSGKVYGTDFAYHEITGTYQKTIRYPVFGIVEEAISYTYVEYKDGDPTGFEKEIAGNIVEAIKAFQNGEKLNFCNGQEAKLADHMYEILGYTEDEDGNTVAYGNKYSDIINASSMIPTENINKRGFVCIIEEGDALASLTTYHAGALSDYNTVKMQFTPRPKDSYNISDSISVGANSEWTVVSDRKYVGNYSMKYIMLSDADKQTEEQNEVYDASWFGMAVAYRDYLTKNKVISKLTKAELTSDIPLYIETFGAIETTEKILSIPVTVMAPLTTFENIQTMYDELSGQGMKNINFKLTGYANGGMWYTMPGNLKFEKAVGGNEGFQELLDKAELVNNQDDSKLGVFPDFDFAYMTNSEMFDGHSALKHNAKTIDNRYASKRVYKATQQKYENYYEMVISPAYFAEFYEKLTKNYKKYTNVMGISVSTLGSALNSDFDEDEPYNREDSKEFTVEAFKYFSDNYSEVMTNGGNAYTWKYVDHMLGVSLDSSRYNFASEAVPFIGVVLHGSIRFAGEPLNMEGDLKYAMLKAIENGASPYFILSYQNTQVLKEDEVLSKYYSIRYDIWKDDIYDTYSVLNDVLSDVQDKYIVGHSFLSGGERIPDSDELTNDILSEYESLLESHRNAAELLEKELERAASIARENGRLAEEYVAEHAAELLGYYNSQKDIINKSVIHDTTYYNNLYEAYAEFQKVSALKDSSDPEERAQYKLMEDLYTIVRLHNKNIDDCNYESEFDEYNSFVSTHIDSKDFWTYRNVVIKAYDSYASESFADAYYAVVTGAANDKISTALANYKDNKITKAQLLEIINTYGAASITKTDFDKNVAKYINLEEKKSTNDTTLKNDIEKWFKKISACTESEMISAIDAFAKGETTEANVKTAMTNYFGSMIDKDAILAKADALIAAKLGTKPTANDIAEYEAAADDLIWSVIGISDSAVTALADEYTQKEEAYNRYLAAEDAINAVKISGVQMTYAECFEVFYNMYKTEKYEDYSKLIRKYTKTCSEEDRNAYYAFYDADKLANEITSKNSEIEKDFSRKTFENYIGALVKLNWMKANRDNVTDEELSKQEALVLQTRRVAVTSVSSTGLLLSDDIKNIIGDEAFNNLIESTGAEADAIIASTTLKAMKEIYDTAREHVKLAEAAIEILAASEDNYQIKYNGEPSLLTIDLTDPEMPFVVKEAVERARATYFYIEQDRYEIIEDGYVTQYVHNGNTVYQSKSNSNIYFYGNYETGYQYLKMTKDKNDNVIFSVYDLDKDREGVDKDGNTIYSNVNDAFGKNVFYAIINDEIVYYTRLASGVFVEKAPTVYNGVPIEVRDGIQIYKDGEVYYSVNNDGSYQRYTRIQCMKSCYEEIIASNEMIIESVASIQNNEMASDSTILNDILARMEIAEKMDKRNNNEEEEVEAAPEISKYETDNVVCVVYGNDDGSAYKTIILNYNNYAIKIEYKGVVYTIPAHYFVIHE